MKRWFKSLSWFLIILLVVFGVLVTNPNMLKPFLENYLSGITGFQVHLDGDLELDLGGLSTIHVNDAWLGSASDAGPPELLRIGQLSVSLVTTSVFSETILLGSIRVDNANLLLSQDKAKQRNWRTDKPRKENTGEAGKTVKLNKLQITNTRIRYRNVNRNVDHELQIDEFGLAPNADGLLLSSLHGFFNGRVLSFAGHLGPYDNLLNGENIHFDAEGSFGHLTVRGKGVIDYLLRPRRPEFDISLKGENIDEITSMLKIDDLGQGGFLLNATSVVSQDGVEAVINGNIGEVALNLVASAEDFSSYNRFGLRLSASGPRLGAITRAFGLDHWPDKPFDIRADVQRDGPRLDITDAYLEVADLQAGLEAHLSAFPRLATGHANLKVRGDDINQFGSLLGIPTIEPGYYDLEGSLEVSADGAEQVEVTLRTGLGRIKLAGSLEQAPGYSGSRFKLLANGDRLGSLVALAGVSGLPDQPFSLAADMNLLDEAMQLSNAILTTRQGNRLAVDGVIAFQPGLKGSNLTVDLTGADFQALLQGFGAETRVPASPYQLTGRFRLEDQGLNIDGAMAVLDGMTVNTRGLVTLEKRLLGTRLDVDIAHVDISRLTNFEAIGNSLFFLLPGQALKGSGRLQRTEAGWKVSGLESRLGTTAIGLEGLLVLPGNGVGSFIDFTLDGPDPYQLLNTDLAAHLAGGRFTAKGRLSLDSTALRLAHFELDTSRGRANIDAALDWPVTGQPAIAFDLHLRGEDISTVFPANEVLQLTPAAFQLDTSGHYRHQLWLEKFEAVVGDLEARLEGEVSTGASVVQASGRLSVSTPDLAKLGNIHSKPLPAAPLQLQADITSEEGRMSFEHLSIRSGPSDINGTLVLSLSGSQPKIEFMAEAERLDARPFLADEKDDEEQAGPADSDRLIPETELPLVALNTFDMVLDLKVNELNLRNATYRNLTIKSTLDQGALKVDELYVDAPKGKLLASLSVNPDQKGSATVNLDLKTTDFFMNLAGLKREDREGVPLTDADIRLSGYGHNLRQLAATANGFVSLKSRGGKLDGVDLSALEFFVVDEVFKLVMPKSDAPKATQLTCAAVFLNVENGLLATEPALAVTTDQLTIVSSGTVDLKTENINFNFNATPNQAFKFNAGELINSFILIKGTLAKPTVGLDPKKTLLQGSVAVGTAGLSILAKGILDRVSNTRPLCEEMLNTEYPPQPGG
jgi:uncharacterized protein involved in outer membrane biogenesis